MGGIIRVDLWEQNNGLHVCLPVTLDDFLQMVGS
jgi:hypothetical protein